MKNTLLRSGRLILSAIAWGLMTQLGCHPAHAGTTFDDIHIESGIEK